MKKRGKKIFNIIIVVILVIALMVGGFAVYGNYQMSKVPELSFKDCLNYTLKGNVNAVITVGIIKEGQATYTVYGKDGVEMPQVEHTYEIGSLTKTFTAALIEKAIIEGKINLDDTIDKYLDTTVERETITVISALVRRLKRQLLSYPTLHRITEFQQPLWA